MVQNIPRGEADFKRFMPLRNHLVIAAESLGSGENLSPVLKPTMSKDWDGQLKLSHKLIDVVDHANRDTYVSLLQYNVEKIREFLCSNPSLCKEEGQKEVSTNCLIEKKT